MKTKRKNETGTRGRGDAASGIMRGKRASRTEDCSSALWGERGFTLTELLIAMMVFTIIAGSVVLLLSKSQTIFRTEQGVSEMDQNARLMMDFLTRDIQQSKENALGLGPKFRSIHSYNGPEGKTDELTVVSSDTETEVPAAALPLFAANRNSFSAADHYVEVVPNGAARAEPLSVINSIKPGEEFIISSMHEGGAVQFDFIKVKGARLNHDGSVGISFDPVAHRGVESEFGFGQSYENGAFAMRPVTIKRYFIDRADEAHPTFSLSIDEGPAISIARNVVAFQVRYLEVRDGEVEGRWSQEQNISREYKTQAIEVTLTARTEIEGDKQAERLVTLASVIRPRTTPGGDYGTTPGGEGGGSNPGGPGDGGGPGGGGGYPGDPGGSGDGGHPGGGGGYGDSGGPGGAGWGNGGNKGGGAGQGGRGGEGYDHRTRRIGKQPRLGERLNPRP